MQNVKKLVIGIVGEKAGGKEAFTKLLKQIVAEPIGHHRSSDVLGETLKIWEISPTRPNYTTLVVSMDQGFGKGTLTHAVRQRLEKSPERIVIFDGIRWPSDIEMIHTLEHTVLVYVTAEAEIRWQRSLERGEKVGESEASWEAFLAEENLETERYIPEIGRTADITIENNGTWDEFQKQVVHFCEEWIL